MKRRLLTASAAVAFALMVLTALIARGDPGLTSTYEGPAVSLFTSLDYGGVPSIFNASRMSDLAFIGRVVHIDRARKSSEYNWPVTRIEYQIEEVLGAANNIDRNRYRTPTAGDRFALTYNGGELDGYASPTGLHLSLGDRAIVFAYAFPPTFSTIAGPPGYKAMQDFVFKINADDTVTVREPYQEAGPVPVETLIEIGRSLGEIIRQAPLPSTPQPR